MKVVAAPDVFFFADLHGDEGRYGRILWLRVLLRVEVLDNQVRYRVFWAKTDTSTVFLMTPSIQRGAGQLPAGHGPRRTLLVDLLVSFVGFFWLEGTATASNNFLCYQLNVGPLKNPG